MSGSVCPYYLAYAVGRLSADDKPLMFCAHKHSGLTLTDVREGSAKSLRCGGDLAKCEVPFDKRLDL